MAKFKNGDKVRIRKDIRLGGLIMSPMEDYAGRAGTITEEEFGDYKVSVSGALWWPSYAIEKREPLNIIQWIMSIFTERKEK